ncbi:MAG: hypothetical protein RMK52_07630 [Chitinophagales bacterium]|nr:hypothetical protein [Chitinophagales bacterium]MDW8394098.1 hypothetical protein [Chitinophagales bacterium]
MMVKRCFGFEPAVAFGMLAFLVSSCTSDVTPEPSDTNCVDSTQVISYVNDIVPIINTYCSNPSFGDCHQPGASNPDFTNYDELKLRIEGGVFQDRVFGPFATGQRMPPAFCTGCPTELDACDKEILLQWIDQGFPNN